MQQLHKLTLRDMARRIQEKRCSATEVTAAHLARITTFEPHLHAWEHLDFEAAMNRARSIDTKPTVQPEIRELLGATIAVKDIIDVAGMPTKYGSSIYASAPNAGKSAHCVQLLEQAGAIIVGKTVTTEFAYYHPGKTRNPWNSANTPGGSSMGSAVSVACGMVAAALGTQTNGSIIRPAAFCGVVGFKPSYQVVLNDGTLSPWPTLDHVGVFARNVLDAAVVAAVIANKGAISSKVKLRATPPRLAAVNSPVWNIVEQPQGTAFSACVIELRNAGAQVDQLVLPALYGESHRAHRIIMAYEGARHFGALQRSNRTRMSDALNQLLDEGASISDQAYENALSHTDEIRLGFRALMDEYDAILTPPCPGEAPATLEETGSPVFCTIWTLLGAPALTIPVALGPTGLPLGLQIVGRIGNDDSLLSTAAWCEKQLPFHNAPIDTERV